MKISLVEKKMADWTSVFDLMPDKQNQEARILKGLINELQHAKREETVVVSS